MRIFIYSLILLNVYSCNRQSKIFEETIGCYRLDLKRTILGNYNIDSLKYQNLEIVFKSDSTFALNMHVPFILDTSGKWIPSKGGIDDWSWLAFSQWRELPSENNGNTFSDVFVEDRDSILYLKGVAYKKGFSGIQEIYFRKIPCD